MGDDKSAGKLPVYILVRQSCEIRSVAPQLMETDGSESASDAIDSLHLGTDSICLPWLRIGGDPVHFRTASLAWLREHSVFMALAIQPCRTLAIAGVGPWSVRVGPWSVRVRPWSAVSGQRPQH